MGVKGVRSAYYAAAKYSFRQLSNLNIDKSKCYGEFCQGKSAFFENLALAAQRFLKAPQPATLLYKYIIEYGNDLKRYKYV